MKRTRWIQRQNECKKRRDYMQTHSVGAIWDEALLVKCTREIRWHENDDDGDDALITDVGDADGDRLEQQTVERFLRQQLNHFTPRSLTRLRESRSESVTRRPLDRHHHVTMNRKRESKQARNKQTSKRMKKRWNLQKTILTISERWKWSKKTSEGKRSRLQRY